MESNYPPIVSPNGTAGSANTHTLDSAAAGHVLDTAMLNPPFTTEPGVDDLVSPFAPMEPPTDLPPAPGTEEEVEEEAAAEPEAEAAAEPEAEPETPADQSGPSDPTDSALANVVKTVITWTVDQVNAQQDTALNDEPDGEDFPTPPLAPEKSWQEGNFAKYKGKAIVQITRIMPSADPKAETTFDATAVWLDAETGDVFAGKQITGKPLSLLSPIRSVVTTMKLKIAVFRRESNEYQREADSLRIAAGTLEEALEKYTNAKEDIKKLLPNMGNLTW